MLRIETVIKFQLWFIISHIIHMVYNHVHNFIEPIMLRNLDAHGAIATFIEPIMLQN